MYDTVNWVDEKLSQLEQKRTINQLILDGLNNLVANGLDGLAQQESLGNPFFFQDYSAKRELFIAATGIPFPGGGETERAINFLTATILGTANFSLINVARMKQRCLQLQTQYQLSVDELTDRIANLEELSANGQGLSSSTITLGTLQTVSLQSFREKNAVRALGHSYAKGYTRGARTIGGSMIFTIFNEHALAQLIRGMGTSRS